MSQSSGGAALNRTCRPRWGFLRLVVIYYKYAGSYGANSRPFRFGQKRSLIQWQCGEAWGDLLENREPAVTSPHGETAAGVPRKRAAIDPHRRNLLPFDRAV